MQTTQTRVHAHQPAAPHPPQTPNLLVKKIVRPDGSVKLVVYIADFGQARAIRPFEPGMDPKLVATNLVSRVPRTVSLAVQGCA